MQEEVRMALRSKLRKKCLSSRDGDCDLGVSPRRAVKREQR